MLALTSIGIIKNIKAIIGTLSGISIIFKPVHPAKASSQIDFTPFGMVTDIRLEHPINVPSSIAVIFFGRTIDVKGSYTKDSFPNIFAIVACLFMD